LLNLPDQTTDIPSPSSPNILHVAHQPDQETALASRFARHEQFVETPAFRVRSPSTGRKLFVKRRLLVGVLLLGLLSAIPLSRAGAATQAIRSTSNVTLISDLDAAVGTSTLTRTASGISFTLQTSGLQPGHAVTIWWMVTNPDGGVAVLYAAGHVIDESGTAEFGGYLQVGDSDGYVMGDDTSLEDALQATVVLVVRDHGPAKPGIVEQQIHTFGVCNPTCTDLQISVHEAS
jgi:hypothetical protein